MRRPCSVLPSEPHKHVVHVELWLLPSQQQANSTGSEAAPLSCLLPPFSASHWHRSVCVCFSLLLMHEALTSRPRCASDADQQQPLNQSFPLSTMALHLTLSVLEAAWPLQMKLISGLSPPPSAHSCGKWQKTEAPPPLMFNLEDAGIVLRQDLALTDQSPNLLGPLFLFFFFSHWRSSKSWRSVCWDL